MSLAMSTEHLPVLRSSKYDRSAVTAGIVHVGLGAFHRAHQAYYFDEYMDQTGDLNWGIAAVNLRREDTESFSKIAANSEGYILKTLSAGGISDYQLIRSHVSHTDWNNDYDGAIGHVANASIKIITMTVTESGYYLDSTGDLDESAAQIVTEKNDGKKQSIYAYLRAGLKLRQEYKSGAITIMCCDNLRQNGKLLKANFYRYLELLEDHGLIAWLTDNASFPSSMVDRITPKPKLELAEETKLLFGLSADSPVLGEDFIQWVIEDDFKNDFPKLDKVDVTITKDIDPYEETKIRVLNGGHTCLAYLGALMGYDTFDALLLDGELLNHYRSFEEQEVLPVLPGDLPFDKKQYLEIVTTRFTNNHIADSVERICTDGFNKFPIFILPTIRGCFEAGITPRFGIRSIASWYVFANRIFNGNMNFDYVEPYAEQLKPMLGAQNLDKFISSKTLWDSLPEAHADFGLILRQEIESLEKRWPL